MSTTDETEGVTPESPPLKIKRKWTRRKAVQPKAAPAPKIVARNDFAGLTVSACPIACKEGLCVISGSWRCAHPRKGGLDSKDLMNPETQARYNQAQKILGKQMLDAKYA